MATIKEIGKKIISILKKIKKTCSDLLQIAKLKNSIKKEKRNLDKSYIVMGKLYFEHYGTSMQEDFFQPAVDDIQQSLNKIEQLEGEIRFIKSIKICPHCGATCAYKNSFCPDCGNAFMLEPQPDVVFQENIANQDDPDDMPVVPEIIEPVEEPVSQEDVANKDSLDDIPVVPEVIEPVEEPVSQEDVANKDSLDDIPVVPEIIEPVEEPVSKKDVANQDDPDDTPVVTEAAEAVKEAETIQQQEQKSVNKAKNLRFFTITHDEEQEEPPVENVIEEPVVPKKKSRKSSKEKK